MSTQAGSPVLSSRQEPDLGDAASTSALTSPTSANNVPPPENHDFAVASPSILVGLDMPYNSTVSGRTKLTRVGLGGAVLGALSGGLGGFGGGFAIGVGMGASLGTWICPIVGTIGGMLVGGLVGWGLARHLHTHQAKRTLEAKAIAQSINFHDIDREVSTEVSYTSSTLLSLERHDSVSIGCSQPFTQHEDNSIYQGSSHGLTEPGYDMHLVGEVVATVSQDQRLLNSSFRSLLKDQASDYSEEQLHRLAMNANLLLKDCRDASTEKLVSLPYIKRQAKSAVQDIVSALCQGAAPCESDKQSPSNTLTDLHNAVEDAVSAVALWITATNEQPITREQIALELHCLFKSVMDEYTDDQKQQMTVHYRENKDVFRRLNLALLSIERYTELNLSANCRGVISVYREALKQGISAVLDCERSGAPKPSPISESQLQGFPLTERIIPETADNDQLPETPRATNKSDSNLTRKSMLRLMSKSLMTMSVILGICGLKT